MTTQSFEAARGPEPQEQAVAAGKMSWHLDGHLATGAWAADAVRAAAAGPPGILRT
ncbi:hypothetical protein [Paenarthrobacter ureafaciens]|uniref:hypothetical protein n=1 Tax=Paenarthrobacter ureafaciens TaxID=37931 RepID=UPI0015BCD57D